MLKIKIHQAVFPVLLILVLGSCSLEKRLYRSGYHIDWNKKTTAKGISSPEQKIQAVENIQVMEETLTADANIEDAEPDEHFLSLSGSGNQPAPMVEENRNIFRQVHLSSIPLLSRKPFDVERRTAIQDPEEKTETSISGFAIAGFVASMLGLFFLFLIGWPILMGTAGVVLSAVGLHQTIHGKKGKGFAIAGLAIGFLVILLFWLMVLVLVYLFSMLL